MFFTWPYQLGVHIAVQKGNDEYGGTAFMLGWFFESIYIAAWLTLALVVNSWSNGKPPVSMWKLWVVFFGTIGVVTGLVYVWPGSPT